MQGYTVTRYQGDTAFFNAQTHALDLLAGRRFDNRRHDKTRQEAPRRRRARFAAVVSDSGIYYTRAHAPVVTGGIYILMPPPKSGQADIARPRTRRLQPRRSAGAHHERAAARQQRRDVVHGLALAEVVQDTSGKGKGMTVWTTGAGSMTSCDDSIPDYHFEFGEAKRTSDNTIVAAPAILYIKDVPVMWLPFIFSRHEGRPTQRDHRAAVRAGRHRAQQPDVPAPRRPRWATTGRPTTTWISRTWLDWRSSAGSTVRAIRAGSSSTAT